MDMMVLAQQSGSGASALLALIPACIGLVFLGVIIAGMWKTFEKAGKPGWACLIPFYNLWIMVEISGKESWWFFLYFVPLANMVAPFIVSIGIAERFGKGAGYGIGLALLPLVFYPLLGFGDAQFSGSAGGGGF